MLSCPMLLLPYFFSKIQVESRNIFFSSKLIQKMCTAFKYNRPLRVPLLGSASIYQETDKTELICTVISDINVERSVRHQFRLHVKTFIQVEIIANNGGNVSTKVPLTFMFLCRGMVSILISINLDDALLRIKKSRDLILGEVVYIAIIYHIPDS